MLTATAAATVTEPSEVLAAGVLASLLVLPALLAVALRVGDRRSRCRRSRVPGHSGRRRSRGRPYQIRSPPRCCRPAPISFRPLLGLGRSAGRAGVRRDQARGRPVGLERDAATGCTDRAASRRRGLVGHEGQCDRDASRSCVPCPAAAPTAVEVRAVWVAVAVNVPLIESRSFFASGVPTCASVVLFTTEMPTEGLIDAAPLPNPRPRSCSQRRLSPR